jgi:DNA-binding NarL/FixJ family response regulator
VIRVRIESGSAIARAGLAAILADAHSIVMVPDAVPNDERAAGVDVVLIDGGVLEELGDSPFDDESEGTAVVVLMDRLDPAEARRLLLAGAHGVIDAAASPDAIIAAIHAAAAGLTVLSGAGLQTLEDERGAVARAANAVDGPAVTPRETEILRLLAEGLGNKTIARRLGISEHTVKAHVSSILVKLGAGSRAEAVALGARAGLILL